jgi:hypothetical protein
LAQQGPGRNAFDELSDVTSPADGGGIEMAASAQARNPTNSSVEYAICQTLGQLGHSLKEIDEIASVGDNESAFASVAAHAGAVLVQLGEIAATRNGWLTKRTGYSRH